MPYVYLTVAILAEVIGTTFLKLSDGFTKPGPSIATAVGYAVSFYFLSLTLQAIPTGIAYAVWSGLGIVLISVIAWLFLGQRLDAGAFAGMALILAGVLVINLFSKVTSY
ncbi:SMR family transporter [Henriciella sp.]|uniref:SMR family transporter n=1 Tax=Henriciella sp. TaxID=1968823 RepID=UPI00345BA429